MSFIYYIGLTIRKTCLLRIVLAIKNKAKMPYSLKIFVKNNIII